MSKIDTIKNFTYCINLLGQEFFFCVCPIFGIHYDGADSSSIYIIYSLGVFVLTMLFALRDLQKNRRLIKKKLFLLLPVVMTVIFLVEYSIATPIGQEWTWKSYMFFMLFCVPAVLIGMSISLRNVISTLYPYFDAIIFVMTIGLLRSIPTLLITGIASLTGGETSNYNTIAYSSAICFGFTYYGILSNREDRFMIFRNKLYKVISVPVMIALAFCAFSSGGRGGSLLLVLFFIYLTWKFVNRRNIIKVVIWGVPILFVLIGAASNYIQSNPLLSAAYEKGFDRAFQYISDDGSIDTSKSSGRDKIYENAVKMVSENPLEVRGLFKTIGEIGYPHNFFLEILLDGGILYLTFWLVVLYRTIIKYNKMLKQEKGLGFMTLFIGYLLISMIFGGTYLMSGSFWFFLAMVYYYKIEKKRYVKKAATYIAK